VALIGTLGAGKTRLVQAAAEGAGVPPGTALSPTFVLIQHYQGVRTIHHIDAYRLRDEDEFQELGPEELFESDGLTFVEWADRVEVCLPSDHLRVEIDVLGKSARRFRITAVGDRLRDAASRLARAVVAIRSDLGNE
jgi:tRNA threonylcarbamoyladenosine biosynthesis protein TsaE